MKTFTTKLTTSEQQEYETLFPFDQEFQKWVAALEADYNKKLDQTPSIKISKNARFPNLTDKDI